MPDSSLLRLSGLAFVALLVASTVLFGELLGAFGDPDAVFEAYYAEASNRWKDVAGAYVLTAAGIAFLVFSNALRQRLGATDDILGRLVGSSGLLYSALLAVAAAALSAVSFSISFGEAFDDVRPFSSAYAIVPQLGAVLIVVVAPLVASVHIATVALAGRGRVPSVVTAVSLVCAVALLFSVLYLPAVALPVWVLLVAFGPIRAREKLVR